MNYIAKIKSYLSLVLKSKDFHAVIVEGPAGWGKTTTIINSFKELGIEPAVLGSYSTPLHFFNFLHENSKRFVLIDDCAGLFSSQTSMAILKAATWGSGTDGRIIKWGTTTQKVKSDSFCFEGKLVIICNFFPSNSDGLAVKSRSLAHKIEVNSKEAQDLVQILSNNRTIFPNQSAAEEISKYLINKFNLLGSDIINLRTLKLAYELCDEDSSNWKTLIEDLLPKYDSSSNEDYVLELSKSGLCVNEQLQRFESKTGLKRRRFFYIRNQLGVTKNRI